MTAKLRLFAPDEKKPRETKFGYAAILDALGARTAKATESLDYLNTFQKLAHEIEGIVSDLKELRVAPDLSTRFRSRFFGDTLLLTLEEPLRKFESSGFYAITALLNILFVTAVRSGILYRGAVSIGEFVEDGEVALGPAIADAAAWHEDLEFIGCILTPTLTTWVKAEVRAHDPSASPRPESFSENLFLWGAPTKTGPVGTYVLNWPAWVEVVTEAKATDPIRWYYEQIRRLGIPKGTEGKYRNTEAFLHESLRQAPHDPGDPSAAPGGVGRRSSP